MIDLILFGQAFSWMLQLFGWLLGTLVVLVFIGLGLGAFFNQFYRKVGPDEAIVRRAWAG